jgi:NAD+ kinase
MLDLEVLRKDRTAVHEIGLNDVVVSKRGTLARTVDLRCRSTASTSPSYKADGLIVATPTGSTAYCSPRGPIVDPELALFVVNPICPTRWHRPLVLPDRVVIDVSLIGPDSGISLTVDGQIGHRVRSGDRIRISRAKERAKLVRTSEPDYFHLLRTKLKWGERLTF